MNILYCQLLNVGDNVSKYTNLSLFPHESSIIIKDIVLKQNYIQLMSALLNMFLKAIEAFEQRALNKFDAQVGETLCQIRAYKIYLLSVNANINFHTDISSTKSTITAAISQLESKNHEYQRNLKLHKSQRSVEYSQPITLTEFFSSFDCYFEIPKDMIFIFISYFLCHHHLLDDDNIPVSINYSAVKNNLNTSNTYTKKIVHYYQKSLSELSCAFIFELLNDLPEKKNLKEILPLFYMQSDEGRMALPCQAVTEIIIDHMIQNQANLVLLTQTNVGGRLEKIARQFKGSPQKQDFQSSTNDNIAPDAPCVIMVGSSLHINADLNVAAQPESLTAREIVLFNNAAHPQYSGKSLSAYRDAPYDTYLRNNPTSPSQKHIDQWGQTGLIFTVSRYFL